MTIDEVIPLDQLGGKIENGGVTPQGMWGARENNSLVWHVQQLSRVVDGGSAREIALGKKPARLINCGTAADRAS